jgi:hypothetical protein
MEEPTTKEQSTNKTRTVTRDDVRKMRKSKTEHTPPTSNTSNANDGRGDGGGYKKQ